MLQAFRLLESPAVQQAGSELPIIGDSQLSIPPPSEPWTHEAAVAVYLKQQEALLVLLHQAAREDAAARFPIDFSKGSQTLLPHLTSLRQAARTLMLEASWKAYHGDAAGAAESLHAIFCLTAALEQEPFVVSQLVRLAIFGSARGELRRWLPRIEFSEADLVRFQVDLRRGHYEVALQRGLLGERVIGKDSFQAIPLGRFSHAEDYAVYLQSIARLHDSLGHPWPRPLLEAEQIKADLTSPGSNPMKHTLTLLALTGLRANIESAARETALNAAADAAVAAERFRRREGRLPERLEELLPEYLPRLPLDPYTGNVQRMARSEEGIIIYSIGVDGVDNGEHGDDTGKPDVVFELKLRTSP